MFVAFFSTSSTFLADLGYATLILSSLLLKVSGPKPYLPP